MSLTAINAVLEHSPSTGTTRLLEVVLASHVNEERLRQSGDSRVWPSQRRLATLCNCSRRTIQERLDGLAASGRLVDTGERKARGVVVWRLSLSDWTDIPARPPNGATGRAPRPLLDGIAQRLDGHTSTEQEVRTRNEQEEKKKPRDVSSTGNSLPQGLDSSKSNGNGRKHVNPKEHLSLVTQPKSGKQQRLERGRVEARLAALVAQNKREPTAARLTEIDELRVKLNGKV